jgi:hypothetical protein
LSASSTRVLAFFVWLPRAPYPPLLVGGHPNMNGRQLQYQKLKFLYSIELLKIGKKIMDHLQLCPSLKMESIRLAVRPCKKINFVFTQGQLAEQTGTGLKMLCQMSERMIDTVSVTGRPG